MGTEPARILIVAYRTAATQGLYNAVRERAKLGPCEFTLVVPWSYDYPDSDEADSTLALALPFLDRAARAHVDGHIGPADPMDAIRELHEREPFDEIIISTLPVHVSKWLHRDLPRRVSREFKLPVTVVTAPSQRHRDRDREHAVQGAMPEHL